jgi:hypothetical protein
LHPPIQPARLLGKQLSAVTLTKVALEKFVGVVNATAFTPERPPSVSPSRSRIDTRSMEIELGDGRGERCLSQGVGYAIRNQSGMGRCRRDQSAECTGERRKPKPSRSV